MQHLREEERKDTYKERERKGKEEEEEEVGRRKSSIVGVRTWAAERGVSSDPVAATKQSRHCSQRFAPLRRLSACDGDKSREDDDPMAQDEFFTARESPRVETRFQKHCRAEGSH